MIRCQKIMRSIGVKMKDKLINKLSELNPKAITYDGLDSALIDIGHHNNTGTGTFYAVYDYELIISGLIKQGMTRFEAIEFYDFNIAGLGHTHAPIIIGQT